jgi:hypothetical protein
MPGLVNINRTMWVASLLAYPVGYYYTLIAFVACVLGVIKKTGVPSYSNIT